MTQAYLANPHTRRLHLNDRQTRVHQIMALQPTTLQLVGTLVAATLRLVHSLPFKNKPRDVQKVRISNYIQIIKLLSFVETKHLRTNH